MKLSVIIPNYNGEYLLKKNLPKVIKEIARQQDYETEIIVVDDCSTDDSIKYLEAQSSIFDPETSGEKTSPARRGVKLKATTKNLNLKLLKNKRNFGFASAVNRGVNEAEGEIVVLLNTDVYPERGFLDAVLPHFEDPEVFTVGMLDKSIERGNIVRRGRGIAEWRRGMYIHKRGEVDRADTAWVSAGSGVFRKSIWEKLGGLDEIYNPFYWEDIDLSFRARKAGYKVLFEPKSVVVHDHRVGIIKSNYSPRYIKCISFRNQFLFVWKNGDLNQILAHIFWLPYHLVKSIFNVDACFIIGLLWAIKRKLVFKQ